jgi:hypothetical protein
MQESGNRIRLPVLPGFCRFRAEPNKSVHRNTASMKSPKCHETGRFRTGLFDLGHHVIEFVLLNLRNIVSIIVVIILWIIIILLIFTSILLLEKQEFQIKK